MLYRGISDNLGEMFVVVREGGCILGAVEEFLQFSLRVGIV
jgi:hypothetical protein